MQNPTDTPEPDPRAEYIAGLREFAYFLEQYPDMPMPNGNSAEPYLYLWDKDALKATIKGKGQWEKKFDSYNFKATKRFRGITFQVMIPRDRVCEQRVIGTKVVPAREAYIEDVVEWVCTDPILGGAKENG